MKYLMNNHEKKEIVAYKRVHAAMEVWVVRQADDVELEGAYPDLCVFRKIVVRFY